MSKTIPQSKIFSCTQSIILAGKIADAFGTHLGTVITSTYSDGEFQPSYEESIRGTRIFIIGSPNPGPQPLPLGLEEVQVNIKVKALAGQAKSPQGHLGIEK